LYFATRKTSSFVLVKQVNFCLQLVVDLLPDFGGCEEKLLVFCRQQATEKFTFFTRTKRPAAGFRRV